MATLVDGALGPASHKLIGLPGEFLAGVARTSPPDQRGLVGLMAAVVALLVLAAAGILRIWSGTPWRTVDIGRHIDNLEESADGLYHVDERVSPLNAGVTVFDVDIDRMPCRQVQCPPYDLYVTPTPERHVVFVGRHGQALQSARLLEAVIDAESGVAPLVLDGNRVYAELGFVRADASIHRALAFVDMGSEFMEVRKDLYDDLQLRRRRSLSFRIGQLQIDVGQADVTRDDRPPSPLGSDLKVEATLPAKVLQRYRATLDYRSRTLTLASPGAARPDGVPVPIRVEAKTGLAVIDVSIDGRSYPLTIDNGSAYTWVRRSTASEWLRAHPDWMRGVGAVGPSNMMMAGDTTESAGMLLRLSALTIGPMVVKDAGALAAGPTTLLRGYADVFDWYSRKNPERVAGWIGGNVLKAFRLTIDYSGRMSYWVKQDEVDAHDLDQVGITLKRAGDRFIVTAIATRDGRPTVDGILPGDVLLRVDHRDLAGATLGAVYDALHGTPGATRTLTVERNGASMDVSVTVTRF